MGFPCLTATTRWLSFPIRNCIFINITLHYTTCQKNHQSVLYNRYNRLLFRIKDWARKYIRIFMMRVYIVRIIFYVLRASKLITHQTIDWWILGGIFCNLYFYYSWGYHHHPHHHHNPRRAISGVELTALSPNPAVDYDCRAEKKELYLNIKVDIFL